MLNKSKVVLFLSPYKDGQAGNFWTVLGMLILMSHLNKLQF